MGRLCSSLGSTLQKDDIDSLRVGQIRIEKLLTTLVLEHQAGQRESSVISTESIESAEDGDEDAWTLIQRELEDIGLTNEIVRQHREYIVSWIQNALKNGDFEERKEAVSENTIAGKPQYHLRSDDLQGHAYQSLNPLPAWTEAIHPQLSQFQPPIGAFCQEQQPILNDAFCYLDQIKVQFQDQPAVYNCFLNVMKDYKDQAIDTPGVVERISQLLAAFPECI